MSDPCDTGTPENPCKGCPDCGPSSTKRTPDAIAARLGKVSDGPWTAWDRGIGYEVHGPEGEPINMGHRETFTKGDAEFIAMAPNDVAFLLDLARTQQAAIQELSQWAGRSKTGYYDEAQDDVVQIIRPALEVKP